MSLGMHCHTGWWTAIALCLLATSAQARMQRVDPGQVPTLGEGEGLVLVAVDSSVDLSSLRVIKDGRIFGAGTLTAIRQGRSFGLYIAPAGRYQWNEIRLKHHLVKYQLAKDPEFKFEVRPGVINYPGEVLFRPSSPWRASILAPNRGLAAMDWLDKEHPGLQDQYPFVYAGYYPDPFPDFYRQERARHGETGAVPSSVLLTPPEPGSLPIPVETLWRPERVLHARINPKGDLLVLHVRESEERWGIEVVDLKSGKAAKLLNGPKPFSKLAWSGDNRLLISIRSQDNDEVGMAIGAEIDDEGVQRYTIIRLPRGGIVVDALPREANHVLFGKLTQKGELMVHRLDISSQQSVDAARLYWRTRLNVGVADDVGWRADGEGRLRLAIVRREDERVLLHGQNGNFTEVLALSGESDFEPIGLSYEADQIYALTDDDRDQRDLVIYDIAAREISRTLFSKPGVDVVTALFDSRRTPIGVTYYQDGRLVSEYFDADDSRLARMLQQAFPGMTVMPVDRSHDGQQLILRVDASDQPPLLYHLDVAARRAELVADSAPWLAETAFAPSEVISFSGPDGLVLEAFLTLPSGDSPRPLVVYPHGGPIGIADTLHFEPDVQFLASLGYAVLRVNFRGSGGRGKAMREAGFRKLGTLIEDDIDAAILHVLERYPLDEARMCLLGSSYGGFSALVSAMRWPDRFRCAVSIAGVSDRILFFTASDGGRSEEGRRSLEAVLGDPNTEQAQMRASSPLYHYRDIRVPVMLAHGLEDIRVDYEHTRRMARMLAMDGRPPAGLAFEDEGHGIESPDNHERLWNGVAGFLQAHLGAIPRFGQDSQPQPEAAP